MSAQIILSLETKYSQHPVDKNATRLELVNCHITKLPPQIGDLIQLTYIDLTNNALTDLPYDMTRLINLQGLNISNNNFTKIPNVVFNLKLTNLNMLYNNITNIPNEIGNLSNLKELYLSHNQIEIIPAVMGNLSSLSNLYLYDNKLTELPKELSKLKLNTLSISKNNIRQFPSEFINLSLQNLHVDPEINPKILPNTKFINFISKTDFEKLYETSNTEQKIILDQQTKIQELENIINTIKNKYIPKNDEDDIQIEKIL